MKVHRGDVVLLDHPFSDASGSKVRPALVVQADVRNSRLTETIVALITRNLKHVGTDPTQLPPGDNTLIVVYTRTGHVTAHPIDPSGLVPNSKTNPYSWDPFRFTQDGLSSGQ